MLWLFLCFSIDLDISEVGGKRLISVENSGGKTYLVYRQNWNQVDIFVYRWNTNQFSQFPPDPRIEFLFFANVLALEKEVFILSGGLNTLYQVTDTGEYLASIDLREMLDPGENIRSGFVDDSQIFIVTTSKEKGTLYRFDIDSQTKTVLFQEEKHGYQDGFTFLKNGSTFYQLRGGDGQLVLFDGSFRKISTFPAILERDIRATSLPPSDLKKRDFQGFGESFFEAGHLTLAYRSRKKGKRLEAAARFDGKRYLFSRYRPIGRSPDGTALMLYDSEEEELKIVPSNFQYQETPIPPVP